MNKRVIEDDIGYKVMQSLASADMLCSGQVYFTCPHGQDSTTIYELLYFFTSPPQIK